MHTQKKESLPQAEYLRWINDPASGLVKEKRVNGLVLKVKFLPQDFVTLRGKADNIHAPQSDEAKTFLLSIGREEGAPATNLLFSDVKTFEEYKEKFHELHFEMGEYLALQHDSSIYPPALFHLEPTYGLGKELVSTVVFTLDKKGTDLAKAEDLDFVFDDRFFHTGKNHFVFKASDLNNIPTLIK